MRWNSTIDAGPVVDQREALADETIEQCRFAHIGAADDGDAQGLGVVIGGLFALGHVLDGDVGLGLVGAALPLVRQGPLLADGLNDRVAQIAQALTVLGGNRHSFAEPERIGIVEPCFGTACLGLVGDKDDGLSRAAQYVGEGPVGGGQPVLGIDEKKRQIGFADGNLRLRAHAAGQR